MRVMRTYIEDDMCGRVFGDVGAGSAPRILHLPVAVRLLRFVRLPRHYKDCVVKLQQRCSCTFLEALSLAWVRSRVLSNEWAVRASVMGILYALTCIFIACLSRITYLG